MSIYNKYIIKTILFQFLAMLITLTGIIWITQSMRIIDLIVSKGISFIDFLKISALLIPYLTFIIIPVALFFAVISLIYKTTLDKELIIFKSIGLSDFQVAKPIIRFSVLIVALSYLISCYILPLSYRKFKDLQVYFRKHYASILLEEGVFSSQVNNLTIYVDKKVDDNTYKGIMIYDNRRPDKPKAVFAEEGKILRLQNNSWFELYNGSHQEKSFNNEGLSIAYFDKYSLSFNLPEEDYIRTTEPNEKYISELFNIPPDEMHKKNKLVAHGHFRLSWPLNSLALIFIACAMLITGKYQRKEKNHKNLLVGFLGVVLLIISMACNNLTLRNLNFAPLMYLTPIIPIIFSLFRLRNNNGCKNY